MVSFTDGVPDDMPLESPLGDALAGFNDGSNSSLTLGGTVVETPTKAGFTATITGWNEMDKGRVTAN